MTDFPIIKASKLSLSRRKLIFEIAINDADYIVKPTINGERYVCKYYDTWLNMLSRCYSNIYNKINPSYIECESCVEWLLFSNFRKWMIKQDWHGKCLDKDILVIGNKVYSPENCMFVSQEINKLLITRLSKRGVLPIGVCFDKENKKYISVITINGRSKNLGRYEEIEEARAVYSRVKSEYIYEIAYKQNNSILRDALIRHAINYRLGKVA